MKISKNDVVALVGMGILLILWILLVIDFFVGIKRDKKAEEEKDGRN